MSTDSDNFSAVYVDSLAFERVPPVYRPADLDAAARAELSALSVRVEPHFLYNVLETIAGLISADSHAAEAASTRLGRMFRRVLDDTRSHAADVLIALDQELALVRDPLQIEQLRLGERLRIIERVADGCAGMAVPPFTLQILVENAVSHGIVPCREGGAIAVAAMLEARAAAPIFGRRLAPYREVCFAWQMKAALSIPS